MEDADLGQLAAETALAHLGLKPVLEGAPRLSRRPVDLGKQIRALLAAFLASPKRAPLQPDPPFDFDEVTKLLDESGTEPQLQALRAAVPGDLGDAVKNQATKTILALREQIPRTVHQDVMGTKQTPGTDMDVARFARSWAVATDPLIVLRDLCEGSLTSDQVEAFATYWPQLYAAAKDAVIDGLTDMRTARPKWELEPRRDALLRKFMGLEPVNTEVAADFQALYAQMTAEPPAADKAPGASVNQLNVEGMLETPGQK